MFHPHILLMGAIIFVARICDASIGTIVRVQGRSAIAFTLVILEISIWEK